jgi:hypothetical protein
MSIPWGPSDEVMREWERVYANRPSRHVQNVLDCLHRRSKYVVGVVLVDYALQTTFVMSAGVN